MEDPLVVTLVLEEQAQSVFAAQRAQLFPAGRTYVGAHVTLFHALPGEMHDEALAALHEGAAIAPPPVRVAGVRSLGRGVAYDLECPAVSAWRERCRARWSGRLTRQDDQRARLHVTVQNKVSSERARETLALLREGFAPWRTTATGLALWAYEGGPWRALESVAFSAPEDAG